MGEGERNRSLEKESSTSLFVSCTRQEQQSKDSERKDDRESWRYIYHFPEDEQLSQSVLMNVEYGPLLRCRYLPEQRAAESLSRLQSGRQSLVQGLCGAESR